MMIFTRVGRRTRGNVRGPVGVPFSDVVDVHAEHRQERFRTVTDTATRSAEDRRERAPLSVPADASPSSSANGDASLEILGAAAEDRPWAAPSWDEVVRNHGDRVYRLAFRLSGNRADAEDLTQETFVRVFRSLSDFTPGTFEGWLHRITTNLFLDMVRRRGRIRFDALPDDAADRLPSRSAGPEQTYAENHLDPEIQSALDSLPADFRAAVVLCDLEELSYEEIAATLNVKVGTVRSRIHRGRVLLREALAHRAPGVRPLEPGLA